MAIFIDSADPDHIRAGLDLGWISGVTTNPMLLAKSNQSALITLRTIKSQLTGPIFYQLTRDTFKDMLEEAHEAQAILEGQLVVKLPPSELGFKVCATLSSRMACCPTAIYAPAQALIAREAGAQYLAVYVNRASRLMGDGLSLVSDIAAVLKDSSTTLLAASLKSPEEAVSAWVAGADHLTLPHATLMAMSRHELSDAAVSHFKADGMGLASSGKINK